MRRRRRRRHGLAAARGGGPVDDVVVVQVLEAVDEVRKVALRAAEALDMEQPIHIISWGRGRGPQSSAARGGQSRKTFRAFRKVFCRYQPRPHTGSAKRCARRARPAHRTGSNRPARWACAATGNVRTRVRVCESVCGEGRRPHSRPHRRCIVGMGGLRRGMGRRGATNWGKGDGGGR